MKSKVYLITVYPVVEKLCLTGCNFSSDFNDVGWYLDPVTVDAYAYFMYGSQITYGFRNMEACKCMITHLNILP